MEHTLAAGWRNQPSFSQLGNQGTASFPLLLVLQQDWGDHIQVWHRQVRLQHSVSCPRETTGGVLGTCWSPGESQAGSSSSWGIPLGWGPWGEQLRAATDPAEERDFGWLLLQLISWPAQTLLSQNGWDFESWAVFSSLAFPTCIPMIFGESLGA